ncbi:MAG: DMT family transporter [Cyclobacteriaceae bacterium]|nr:DMT family transporter [Cyclobacteriaceae bacterium]
MLLAVFFFSVMNVLIKLLPHIPAVEIVFFRAVVSLIISVSILKYYRINLWGTNHKWLILRGFSGMFSLILYFELMQSIPLASAVTILFLSPIFTNILGTFIVRERVMPSQWFFYLLSFSGILLVKGFDTRIEPIHLVIGIGASIFSGLAYNFIRKIKTAEHPLVIIFYFPLVTMPFTGIASTFNWVPPAGWDWVILISVGILTQTAQYFMTRSYQSEELSKVANLRYLSIIFAWSFGFFIFNETYTVYAYLGMLLAVAGVVLNLWYRKKIIVRDSISR